MVGNPHIKSLPQKYSHIWRGKNGFKVYAFKYTWWLKFIQTLWTLPLWTVLLSFLFWRFWYCIHASILGWIINTDEVKVFKIGVKVDYTTAFSKSFQENFPALHGWQSSASLFWNMNNPGLRVRTDDQHSHGFIYLVNYNVKNQM
jgi:hypothetical protein